MFVLFGKVGHSVLVRSDGTAVACGHNRLGQCNIPDLVEGVTYTQVDTGQNHTVLLASDGTAAACGSNEDGECNVPALSDGVIYTQVATGAGHTVLLKSDGTVVACGRNRCGQCNIPTLPDGVVYVQVGAGHRHTVLLASDGTVAACGSNVDGECNAPALSEGVVYTHVAAGDGHTVLLKSDGAAVACGYNMYGQCDIPALADGVTYVQLACGPYHTVLLMSDGTAVGCGCDWCGCRNFLALIEGVAYTHVVAIGMCHTVLLTCDGNAVACGRSQWGQCSIPDLPRGVTYVHRGARMVLTLFFCESHAAFCFLSGTEVCRVEMDDSDRLINIRRGFQNKMKTDHGEFLVVLPGGEFLNAVCAHSPAATVKSMRDTFEPMVWPSIFPSAYVYGDGAYGITRRSECDATGVKLGYRPQLQLRELTDYVIDGDDLEYDCAGDSSGVVCEGSGALEKGVVKDSLLLCGRSNRDPPTVMYDLNRRWGCIHAARLYACIARWSSDLKKLGAMPGSDMYETVKIVGENAGFEEFLGNKNVGARIKAMMRHVPYSYSRVVGANAARTTERHICNSCRMMWGEPPSFTIANIDDAGQSLMKLPYDTGAHGKNSCVWSLLEEHDPDMLSKQQLLRMVASDATSQVLFFDTMTKIFVGVDISSVLWRNVDWVVSVQLACNFGMVVAYSAPIERQGCGGIHAHMHLAFLHPLTADVVDRSLAVEQWLLI